MRGLWARLKKWLGRAPAASAEHEARHAGPNDFDTAEGPVLLLVGLGNPGAKYAKTRHNIGFMAVDAIARRNNFGVWRKRFRSETAEGLLGTEKVVAMKPQTYMNLSGDAVGDAARFFKLTPDRVVVFHDDLDLAPGKLRMKTGGGHAGHNGLKSITQHIGAEFRRVRMGIGHPGDKKLVHSYVLQDVPKDDWPWVEDVCDAVADEIDRLVAGDDQAFMSRVAQKLAPPDRPKTQSTKT